MEEININDAVKTAWDKADKDMGRVNILIAGKTGVGKSTLVNSVFGEELAETGQGRPVTQEIKEYYKEGIPVHIFDTPGLEVKDYKRRLQDIKQLVHDRKTKEIDDNNQIHVAWVCITEDSGRVEDAEIELVELLSEDVPVIVVITKARNDNGFKAKVEELLQKAKNVIRVRALQETFDEGITLPQMNLDKLVDLTEEVIPEGKRNAFISAQKVSLKKKVKRAQGIIAAAAAAAAATGASPIPFSDAVILVPIEIGMLAGITRVFGLSLSKGMLSTLVSSMLGTTAATISGKTLANFLKAIPGVGTIVGGVISASTGGVITTALGELYVGTLTAVCSATKGEPPKEEDIEKEFMSQLKKKKDNE